MFSKIKTYFYILLFVIPFTICTLVFSSRSYGLEATALGSALWNSFNLASEYYVGRAGRNIVNANQISTDVTNIGGINSGTMSEAYGEIVSSAQGGTPINVSNLLALAQDVDTSNMSLSELNALSVQLANTPWNTDGSIVMKNIAYGGVSLYFAVDKLGEWVGNSYDNIVAKFGDMTVSKATSITNKSETLYPQTNGYVSGYGTSMSFVDSNGNGSGYIKFNEPVFFYTTHSGSKEYLSVLRRPSASFSTGTYYRYDSTTGNTETFSIRNFGYNGGSTVLINGQTFNYGRIKFQYYDDNYTSTERQPYLMGQFQSLQNGIDFFTNLTQSSNIGYQAEIIDKNGVPYLVDDLGDFATTIGDLYPVIEKLRETISTIPTTDDLASIISDQVKAEITDLIDGIKEKSLTIDDSIVDTGTVTDAISQGIDVPPDLPTGILENFSNVIKLPFRFFSIFSPIFQIFGASSSVFALWLFFPSFLIIMLIIWALK